MNEAAAFLVKVASERGLRIACAESCTAGLVSSLIAELPGASKVLWGSFVTYTNEAKMAMLGVHGDTLAHYSAVSRQCACEMAAGALAKSGADIAVSVTGYAGPDGSDVGLVWIGSAQRGGETAAAGYHFKGGRNQVRMAAASEALATLCRYLKHESL